jgi:serine/threonine kinase 32
VYEGKGYSCEVDWWSLGVVFYEAIYNKRPFEGHNHEQLGQKILRGEPAYPQTNPPISNPCLHAISSLLEKDRRQRIGAIGFQSFTDNVFFRDLDFEAVERKEVEPVFLPSTEKTNFDATYDLEELLLEEAPLEARARRQKPRELLKDDATQAEIRADELHKMIETLFEPFDYTLISPEEAKASSSDTGRRTPTGHQGHTIADPISRPRTAHRENERYDDQRGLQISPQTNLATRSRSSTHSPNGSPPLPQMPLDFQFTTQESQMRPARDQERERSYGIPNTHSAIPRSTPDDYHDYLKDSKSMASFEPPPGVHIQGLNQGNRRRGQTNVGQPQHDPQSRSTSANAQPQYYTQTGSSQHQLIAGPAYENRRDDEPPLPVGSGDERDPKRPSGMLGFLSRKKGRDRSPKAKERGVLGKEGARQIVNEK